MMHPIPPCQMSKTHIIYTELPLITGFRFFLKIPAVSHSFTLLTLTSCKISETTNERSLRYHRRDQQTDGLTDRQGQGMDRGDY